MLRTVLLISTAVCLLQPAQTKASYLNSICRKILDTTDILVLQEAVYAPGLSRNERMTALARWQNRLLQSKFDEPIPVITTHGLGYGAIIDGAVHEGFVLMTTGGSSRAKFFQFYKGAPTLYPRDYIAVGQTNWPRNLHFDYELPPFPNILPKPQTPAEREIAKTLLR